MMKLMRGIDPRTQQRGNEMTESNTNTITPKELAVELGTDQKTCRRFLRSLVPSDARPGKGARWAIDSSMVEDLQDRFAAYTARKSTTLTADSLSEGDAVDEVDDDDVAELVEADEDEVDA